ncbi:hypothetical protein [Nonomuraea sp. MG754425]|uniref:hypothetical protein n=1 Tax=Nonomuraea sp. MG754425 TaxID=2570319 RepID=UPI001F3AFA0F|nr:hypothetical protein [Nonomuraea sp. MG754425]
MRTSNAKPFNGFYVFFRGIQTPYHRSYSMILEYDEELMKLFTSPADEDWYKTDLGSVLDVHGLVMHEFGHAVAFHDWWEGMAKYQESGGADDEEVIAYQGYPVPLDGSAHVPGEEPYWDRLSGQSGGWRPGAACRSTTGRSPRARCPRGWPSTG